MLLKSVIPAHTCAIPDVPGLKAEGSAAQGETVGPLPTAPPPGFQQLFRIVVPGIDNTQKTKCIFVQGLRQNKSQVLVLNTLITVKMSQTHKQTWGIWWRAGSSDSDGSPLAGLPSGGRRCWD